MSKEDIWQLCSCFENWREIRNQNIAGNEEQVAADISKENSITMICILLVAGHDTSLDEEIKRESSRFGHLEGVPKALLPGVGGKKILDYWWAIIKNRQLFSQVCNNDIYAYFFTVLVQH